MTHQPTTTTKPHHDVFNLKMGHIIPHIFSYVIFFLRLLEPVPCFHTQEGLGPLSNLPTQEFRDRSPIFPHRKVRYQSPTFPHRKVRYQSPTFPHRSGTTPRFPMWEGRGLVPDLSMWEILGLVPKVSEKKLKSTQNVFICKKNEQNNLSLTFLSGKVWDWFQKSQKIFLKSTQNVLKCEKITSP